MPVVSTPLDMSALVEAPLITLMLPLPSLSRTPAVTKRLSLQVGLKELQSVLPQLIPPPARLEESQASSLHLKPHLQHTCKTLLL